MDFTRPVNAPKAPRPKRGGRFRRFALWGAATVGVLMGLILAAPTLLSTAWARAWALGRANAALAPAHVEAKDWSLAWFGEQRVEGIAYRDEARGIRATVREIRLGSLWRLLPIGKVVAEVAVTAPEIVLSPAPEAATPTLSPAPPGPTASPATRTPPALPAWALSAHVTVTEATVRWATLPEALLSQGRLELTLPALDQDLALSLTGQLLDATVAAEAALPPLGELLAAARPTEFLRTAQANLAAPWGTLSAAAQATPSDDLPRCQADATLDLAKALVRARTLGVRVPGLEAATGRVTLATALAPAKAAKGQTLTVDLTSHEVTLTYEGKTLRLSPRLGLTLTADPAAPLAATLERLSLDFPGLMASGKGSLAKGTLAAQLDAGLLLETFRPFLGDVSLAAPLTVRLDARADGGAFGMGLKASSGGHALADVSLSAEGIDPKAQTLRAAKLNATADLAEALRFAPLPNGQRLKGTLLLSAAGAGAWDDFKGKALLAVRDVDYRAASWKVGEPSLLEAEADFMGRNNKSDRDPGWAFDLSALKLTTPVSATQGTATYRVRPGRLTASLSGSAQPGKILTQWRVWGKDEMPLTLSGDMAYDAQLSYAPPTGDGRAHLRLEAEGLSVTLPPHRAFPLPLKAEATAALGKAMALEALSLATPYLSLRATGGLEANRLTLQGELTPDFGVIFRDLPFFDGLREHVSVTGRHTRPFALEGPLDGGAAGLLNYGKGHAEVAFDRIAVPGLDIPGGSAKATLADGVAALDGALTVNGGTLRLSPRVALGAKPCTVTLPDGAKVLEGVALTQELLDTALKYVNPLLPGSATPQGTLDLTCDRLTLPLDGNPLADLETRLTLSTHGCGLRPNGLLGTVLGFVRVADKTALLPDQDFSVRVAEGKLVCDPIRMRIAAVKLDCSGSTNLMTRELDYTLSLPLTQQLLGDRLAKRLRVGDVLRLPIRGTLDRPALDTGPLVGALADSALGRAADRLSEGLGKALRKGGEAGVEAGGALGGAAGDVLRAAGEGGAEAGERVEDALRTLFRRKKK